MNLKVGFWLKVQFAVLLILTSVGFGGIYAARAGTTSFNITPASGGQDSMITVTGSGWTPGENVSFYWGIIDPNTNIGSAQAASDGTFTSIVWSFFENSGDFTIFAKGQVSKVTLSQAYTVLSPTLILSSASGLATSATASGFWGDGYDAPDTVSIYWNYSGPGTGTKLAELVADREGEADINFNAPIGTQPGTYKVAAIGSFSNLTAISTITIDGGPSPVPSGTPIPSGQISLNRTGGPPGTYVVITANGFQPGEQVEPIWNYTGPGTGIDEAGFYYFKPIQVADPNGAISASIFTPSAKFGTYTIAEYGLTSNRVKTGTFNLTPEVDLGVYQGGSGSTLRLAGWGFGAKETVNLFWNWSSASNGTSIGTATADGTGAFTGLNFTVPAGTVSGKYTVAALGTTSHTTATAIFTDSSLPNTSSSPADWTQYGYDLQGTRVNAAVTSISQADAGTLAVKWHSATSPIWKVIGGATEANGIVYVGTVQGTINAFNATTGNLIWSFAAKGPVYSPPTIANGIAYFGSVDYPGEGPIGNDAYALNAQTGQLIWYNNLTDGGVWSTPLVSNGRVFFPTAQKEALSGGFQAFNTQTGAVLWTLHTAYGIWTPDVLDPTGTHLYVGTGNPCRSDQGGASPSPTDGCAGSVQDINPATGQVNWKFLVPDVSGDDDIATSPTYANGKVYVGAKNGKFYALNASNGTIAWQYDTGGAGVNGIFSSGAYQNGVVFFGGGGDHTVHALNANTGTQVWSFKTGANIFASPVLVNNILIVSGSDGNVYALNPGNGALFGQIAIGSSMFGETSVANGTVYQTSTDGNLYAITPGGR